MTVYQVSTPRYTCAVVVDGRGTIQPQTARYLHRWYGGLWGVFRRTEQAKWGPALRIAVVGDEREDV